jgi:carbon monoxide dehydrogenase subunit G
MNIEGAYTFQASPEEVWNLLTSIPVLQQTLSGLSQLEPAGQDRYQLSLQINQAPLEGTYEGLVKITERQYPAYLCFVIEGLGEQNALSGIGGLYLQKQEQLTVVTYKGTLHVDKLHGRLNTTVIKGAAKLLIQQSLTRLSEQLRPGQNGHNSANKSIAGTILALPRPAIASKLQQKTIWQGIGHQLHLGGNDPKQEEIWGRRVGQAGSAAGLLLLVWMGTRIPRKRRKS